MGKLSLKNSRNKIIIVYSLIFILLFLLCLLFPYSGDDWAWGSQIGLNRLNTWFENYSGRYFGNLIVLALTRSNFLKAFVMSFCLTGIIVIVNKLTGEQKNGVFIISTVLVFMPVTVLRQAIVWTSGFANYTTSIFLTLIYIYYVRNIYVGRLNNSFIAIIPLAALGFANTLIVEHLTIYNVILSVYVLLFTLIKFKKIYVQHIAYFAGTIAGAVLMFSNSVYRSVANGSDNYRTISSEDNIIIKALKSYFNTIVNEGFINNLILNLFLVGVCLITWFSVKNRLSKKAKVSGLISILVMVAFVSVSLMLNVGNPTVLYTLKYAVGLATGAYILAFIIFLIILPFEMNQKIKMIFILGSTGCMIAPLLIVTPIGSRCFFAPYVMMLYLGMELYSAFDETVKKYCEKVSRAALITALVGLLYLFYIYGTISICNHERVKAAQTDARNGAEIIQVEELPYKNYVWCSDVDKKIWKRRFKLFYDIDKNVKIEQIPSQQKW